MIAQLLKAGLFVSLLGFAQVVAAQADCDAVFADAAQTHKSGGKLDIKNNAKIINSPDNILDTTNLSASALSCVTVSCSGSGSPSPTGNYTNFPGGADLDIESNQAVTPGNYDELVVDDGVIVTLTPGDYTFSKKFEIGENATLRVQGGGTVRIYVKTDVEFKDDSSLELATSSDHVFVYGGKKFDFKKRVQASGVFYAKQELKTDEDTAITGMVSGEKITLESGTTVTYDAALRDRTDFNGFCNQSPFVVLDIIVAPSASTCVAHDVTVRACTDTSCASLNTGYIGTVTLGTSTANGDWSSALASGILAPGATDSGDATFQFEAGNGGTATLQLLNTHAEILTVTATDTLDNSITDTSPNVTFSDNVFLVEDIDPLAEGAGGADVAVAGRNHNYRVRFMRRDTSQSPANCAVATSYNNAAQGLKAWIQRSAELAASADPAIGAVTLPEAQPAANNIVLDFSSGGVATFNLATTDVGQYSINMLDDSRLFASNVDVTGSSNQLTVRPFAFDIDIEISGIEDRATNGSGGASYAANDAGSVLTTAGTAFSVELTAVQWQSADDADNNGLADAGANLANNAAAASFGQENAAEQVILSSTLQQPVGGSAGVLSGTAFSGFINGQALRSDVSWSEVGIVQLNAQLADGNYLGSGSNVSGLLGNVGRFTPDRFAASAAVVSEACASGAFSYMGQVFDVTYNLTAQNSSGGTTQNYRSGFIKLDATQGSLDYGAYASASSSNLTGRVQPDAATYLAATTFTWGPAGGLAFGVGELNTRLLLSRAAVPDGQHLATLGVLAGDADAVANAPLDLDVDGGGNDYFALGDSLQRYGRMFLENGFGPETRDLPLPFTAEYFSAAIGSGSFVPNLQDNCSSIALGDFTEVTGSYTNNLDDADTDPVAVSGVSLVNGRGAVTMSAPGPGNDGSVDIRFTLPAHLQYDWDANAGTPDQDPENTATFGSYRGNDRVIYRREVLQ